MCIVVVDTLQSSSHGVRLVDLHDTELFFKSRVVTDNRRLYRSPQSVHALGVGNGDVPTNLPIWPICQSQIGQPTTNLKIIFEVCFSSV